MPSSKREARDEEILTLYHLTGLCVARIARHVGVSDPTVNKVIARYPGWTGRQPPQTIRGRRWDHSPNSAWIKNP